VPPAVEDEQTKDALAVPEGEKWLTGTFDTQPLLQLVRRE
jgi:hypothetical protein